MAKLTRYNPNDRRRGGSLIDRLWEDPWFDWPASPADWLRNQEFFGDNLPVAMLETDEDILIRATLPGVKPEEVDINERQGILTIRARHEQEQEREERGWHIQERQSGEWQRSVRLPAEVKGEKAHAELKDGVLTIRLPKVDSGKKLVNRIKVNLPKLQLPKIGKHEPEIKISRN